MSEMNQDLTAVVLAGGLARRMGGQDKGLVEVFGKPMIEHVLDCLRPQVEQILINANRNHDIYASYNYPVISDSIEGYCGPLAGMASAMQHCDTAYLMATPCDSPFLPDDLVARLYNALQAEQASISVAHDGDRMQPVFALLDCNLLESLLAFLHSGERKIDRWYAQQHCVLADFSDCPDTFLNINSPEDITELGKRKIT
jgi:molybdopterin-guanine dinucleotide biosynthesis protein A